MRILTRFLILSLMVASCKKEAVISSTVKFAPVDRNADNYALLFGAPNDLKGVGTDISNMETLLNDPALGYRVITNGYASKASILRTLQSYSAKISGNGTLLIYFSGHGTSEGEFVTQENQNITKQDLDNLATGGDFKGQNVSHLEVLTALRNGRASAGVIQPIRFLITIIDSCFSGKWNDPNEQLGNMSLVNSGSTGGHSGASADQNFSSNGANSTLTDGEVQSLADRVVSSNAMALRAASTTTSKISGDRFLSNYLTVTAASASEVAIDAGTVYGGRFTYFLRRIYMDARTAQAPLTFRQWLDKTFLKVQPAQHVTYRASGNNILDIDLFSSEKPLVNEDVAPILVNPFDFAVASFMDNGRAKFKISKIINCPASKISWSLQLATGESCSLAGSSCSFLTDKSDFVRDFPEPRRDFFVTGTCGNLKPVTYKLSLSFFATDSDQDGVPNAMDKCPGTKQGAIVEKAGNRAGCSANELTFNEDADQDGVIDTYDLCKSSPVGARVETSGLRKGCAPGEKVRDNSDEPWIDDDSILAP